MAAGSTAVWRLRPDSGFEHRNWAGESVLYVHATAQTHRLDSPTSSVLLTMLEHPCEALSEQQWLQRLLGDAPGAIDEASAEERALVRSALDSLTQLHVAEALAL